MCLAGFDDLGASARVDMGLDLHAFLRCLADVDDLVRGSRLNVSGDAHSDPPEGSGWSNRCR